MTTGDHKRDPAGRELWVALVAVGLCLGALVVVMVLVVLGLGVPWG